MEFNVSKRCTPEIKMNKIAAKLENLKSRFVEIQKACSAALSIFNWCVNIYDYYLVDKNIIPP